MGQNPMVWKEELGNTQESAIYTSLVLVFPEYLLVAAVGKDNTELGILYVWAGKVIHMFTVFQFPKCFY